jgi:hypothetical protein
MFIRAGQFRPWNEAIGLKGKPFKPGGTTIKKLLLSGKVCLNF